MAFKHQFGLPIEVIMEIAEKIEDTHDLFSLYQALDDERMENGTYVKEDIDILKRYVYKRVRGDVERNGKGRYPPMKLFASIMMLAAVSNRRG